MDKKLKKKIMMILAFIGVVVVSGIFALLVDTKQKENNFTIGSVRIELHETSWESEYDEGELAHIIPGDTINKNPSLENTGENPAYVYLRVYIPYEEVVLTDEVRKCLK